jgi:hypothetical protein
MKKLIFSLSILALTVTGCSTTDDEDTTQTPVVGELTGSITSNRTIAFGNYTLKGIVKVHHFKKITFICKTKMFLLQCIFLTIEYFYLIIILYKKHGKRQIF